MKLKYYLRGVGVGLILAVALYSTIIIPKKYELSDDEIIKRAQQLGLERPEEGDIDLSVLTTTPSPDEDDESESEPEPESSVTPDPTPAPPSSPDSPSAPSGIPSPEGLPHPELTGTAEIDPYGGSGQSPDSTAPIGQTAGTAQGMDGTADAGQTGAVPAFVQAEAPDEGLRTFSISWGMNSDEVARLVAEAGLVENALEFDRYLTVNRYSRNIKVGTFHISMGASHEEIAGLIAVKQELAEAAGMLP